MKVTWVTPWQRVCGIADYSKTLWPKIEKTLIQNGVEPVLISMDQFSGTSKLSQELERIQPELIHFQHEYGIWGGKNPPFYWFPKLASHVRTLLPKTKLVATAHTVLSPEYRFPTQGRSWQIPARLAANAALLPYLRNIWGVRSWRPMDAVIVHSQRQIDWMERSGASRVEVIGHFVAEKTVPGTVSRDTRDSGATEKPNSSKKNLLVFGFFTPEKGQDVAIQALAHLPDSYNLTLAGGLRRSQDQRYLDHCLGLIESLGLKSRVQVTGFVESRLVDSYYQKADLVIVPFRETSGSGSLAGGFARGSAILASDLPLNLEMNERVPGCIATFKTGDVQDCAAQVMRLMDPSEKQALSQLKEASRRYALAFSTSHIAEQHLRFYRSLLGVSS